MNESEKIYHRLKKIGLQPSRLYVIAKIHKNGTSLQLDLKQPGSSYESLNNFWSPVFRRLPVDIETYSKDARTALGAKTFDIDELVLSLDVKGF